MERKQIDRYKVNLTNPNMKTIKKTFEPNDENPMEVSSPLTGAIVAVTVGAGLVIIIICVVAFSVYLAETIVNLF